MAVDVFSIESYDFYVTKGDTANLKFEFVDKNGNPINITNWKCKFSLRNPITLEIILTKEHDDTITGGAGIYYAGDTQAPVGLNLTSNNQLVVIINYEETAELEPQVYPFDLEFTVEGQATVKYTAVKGNLIITKEVTPSV